MKHEAFNLNAQARDTNIEDVVARLGTSDLNWCGQELVGPCPRCGGHDRFAVNVCKQVWNCRGCSTGGDAIALVMHVRSDSFLEAVEFLTGTPSYRALNNEWHAPARREKRDTSGTARWLWGNRRPVTEAAPVARYLRGRRYTGEIPPTLGYLPALGEHSDAMIAAFGLAPEVEPGVLKPPKVVTGVHLTRITAEGGKALDADGKAKIMLGPSMGQPIVLAPPNDLLGLAITEGIEDGLSVHQATGLGVWVAGSAGRMPALAPAIPDYIECVTIYAHPDEAGQQGAQGLAALLDARRIEVLIAEVPR